MKNSFYLKRKDDIEKLLKYYKKKHLEDLSLYDSRFLLSEDVRTSVLCHELRDYQMEAIFTMDVLNQARKYNPEWGKFLKDKNVETSMAFHMATGSGKTLLIGGMIYWLHKTEGTKNFLLLTPPAKSVVYDKTLLNFNQGTAGSIWNKNSSLKVEVIHGENFAESKLYDGEPDVRIFVFNTEKFSATAKRTKAPQEMSRWTDSKGNLVSLAEYLEQAKDLVIITDEAHHSAAIDKAIRQMIGNFKPQLLLEFTATSQDSQHVVYDYGIDLLLSQGLCKQIRVLGVKGESNKEVLNPANKRKLIVLLLLHLAKRYSLKYTGIEQKVVSLIKVKGRNEDGKNVFAWLKDNIKEEAKQFEAVIEELKAEKWDIGYIVAEMFEKEYEGNTQKILKDIEILMVGKAMEFFEDASIEQERFFKNIHRNEIELLVYNARLDEGIDLPNIYNIAVINDTDSNMLTSVKQVIGRGIRLFSDPGKRQYDDEEDKIKRSVEQLHVVSDKGKNFERAINQLREDWELYNKKYMASEDELVTIQNTIINPAHSWKLPAFVADHKLRKDSQTGEGIDVATIVKDSKTIIDDFIRHCCFGKNKVENAENILRYSPDSHFSEVEVGHSEDDIAMQTKLLGEKTLLTVPESWMNQLKDKIVREVRQISDTKEVKQAFSNYAKELNDRKIYYYKTSDTRELQIEELFKQQFFYFYRPHILKKLTWLESAPADILKDYPLENIFKEYKIQDISLYNGHEEDLRRQIKNSIWFDAKVQKWQKSYYQYQIFDSATEYKAANLFDKLCQSMEEAVWITNNRRYYLSYGERRYFPDFLIVTSKEIVVVEIKGEFFEDSMKTGLLRLYNKIYKDQNIFGVMLYEDDIDALLAIKSPAVQDILDRNRVR